MSLKEIVRAAVGQVRQFVRAETQKEGVEGHFARAAVLTTQFMLVGINPFKEIAPKPTACSIPSIALTPDFVRKNCL